MQTSRCSPWSSQFKPFPSLRKKMRGYMDERWTITHPFSTTQKYQSRPNPSLFVMLPKFTLDRRRTVKATPGLMRRNYTPRKWIPFTTYPKTVENLIQTWQTKDLFTVMKPVTSTPNERNTFLIIIPAVPNPSGPINNKRSNYCATSKTKNQKPLLLSQR